MSSASLHIVTSSEQILVELQGDWRAISLKNVFQQLNDIRIQKGVKIKFSISKIVHIDSAGAWVFTNYLKSLRVQNINYQIVDSNSVAEQLIAELLSFPNPQREKTQSHSRLYTLLDEVGKSTLMLFKNVQEMLSFLGEVMKALLYYLKHPFQFRFKIFLNAFQNIAIYSLPIIGLISFLIGIVLAYQGVSQLRKFGAEIFTVDLLAVSILRELGVLITSIVIAGRSGSAFTAQISYMKLNQEIDAMQILGLNPTVVLVIPRIVALMIALPFLAFFSDMMGLLGGAFMTCVTIDLSIEQFLEQLRLTLTKWTFWTGIIKAPVFAFIIAFVGCLEGLRAGGGAENVGLQTTRSVVEGIFLVIVLDAFFSIVFSYIGI